MTDEAVLLMGCVKKRDSPGSENQSLAGNGLDQNGFIQLLKIKTGMNKEG